MNAGLLASAIPVFSCDGTDRLIPSLLSRIDWPRPEQTSTGVVVSHHGTERTSNAILAWCAEHEVEWHYIAPGKPMQNAVIESFNGRIRVI